jgi:hypothetical protein
MRLRSRTLYITGKNHLKFKVCVVFKKKYYFRTMAAHLVESVTASISPKRLSILLHWRTADWNPKDAELTKVAIMHDTRQDI